MGVGSIEFNSMHTKRKYKPLRVLFAISFCVVMIVLIAMRYLYHRRCYIFDTILRIMVCTSRS